MTLRPRRAPGGRAAAARFAAALALFTALSCGRHEPRVAAAEAPAREEAPIATIEIDDPRPRVLPLRGIEELTIAIDLRMRALAARLSIRNFAGVSDLLTEDFRGHDLLGAPADTIERLPLSTTRTSLDVTRAEVLDRDEFVASLGRHMGSWRRVEECALHVLDAEFRAGDPAPWGVISLALELIAVPSGGGRRSVRALGRARIQRDPYDGSFRLAQLALEEVVITERATTMFSEVTLSTGVGHEGVRYGQPGNDDDAWNGAAAGDIDGDGRFDLYVPGRSRNFLYRNRGDGYFDEQAQARGLAAPPGGTGCVFFDFDADGDQDLAVARVGWTEPDGSPGGAPLSFHVNHDGAVFTDEAAALGLDVRRAGFSLSVIDHDLDGWPDLFLCGYGRVEEEPNNSWVEATNGAPNSLFRNEAGMGFRDVAPELGLDGASWSYAASAADYDSDGDPDLYVANNFGTNHLYRNDGGIFVDVGADLGLGERGNGFGASWGDFDGDGRLDLFVANPDSGAGRRVIEGLQPDIGSELVGDLYRMASGNSLFLARPEGGFTTHRDDSGASRGHWAWSPTVCDADLDGTLDIYCPNGFVTGEVPNDT